MAKLTFTMENYLEAIYELTGGTSGARVSDISERLVFQKQASTVQWQHLLKKVLSLTKNIKKYF